MLPRVNHRISRRDKWLGAGLCGGAVIAGWESVDIVTKVCQVTASGCGEARRGGSILAAEDAAKGGGIAREATLAEKVAACRSRLAFGSGGAPKGPVELARVQADKGNGWALLAKPALQ